MTILNDKIVLTRKSHLCDPCGRRFQAGTIMRTAVAAGAGEIFTWRECPTCQQLLKNYPDIFYDDSEGCFQVFCVDDELNQNETPEELLQRLNENESKNN